MQGLVFRLESNKAPTPFVISALSIDCRIRPVLSPRINNAPASAQESDPRTSAFSLIKVSAVKHCFGHALEPATRDCLYGKRAIGVICEFVRRQE
jgi:hypothetical protein